MRSTRRHFLGALLAGTGAHLLGGPTTAVADAKARYSTTRISGHAFGTQWQVILPIETRASPVVEEVKQIIELINQALSPWDSESDISRFNRSEQRGWVGVTPVCSYVVQQALNVASVSDGAFDPTVGPLVNRYGFGPITGSVTADHRQVQVQPGALFKSQDGVTLDPCAIAKGYALDLISESLLALGIHHHLAELGGETIACGTHPSGRPWVVGIESPLGNTPKPLLRVTSLVGKALATSGLQYNSYRLSDQRYSHIIEPVKGAPVSGSLLCVSVIAHNAMLADAWSTALMAAGEQNGLALAKRLKLDALFVSSTNNTEPNKAAVLNNTAWFDRSPSEYPPQLRVIATGAFPQHMSTGDLS